ncbi:hypothetical protein ACFL6X_04335 [Candidatus Latescibacterota bacterium]
MQDTDLLVVPGPPHADLKRRLLDEWLRNPFLDEDPHLLGLRLGEPESRLRQALGSLCDQRFLKAAGARGYMLDMALVVPPAGPDEPGNVKDAVAPGGALQAFADQLAAIADDVPLDLDLEGLPALLSPVIGNKPEAIDISGNLASLFPDGDVTAEGLIESMPFGILVLRATGALELANQKAASWLDVPADDLDGATFEIATGVSPLAVIGGHPINFSLTEPRAVEVSLYPATLASGDAVLAVLRDVSLQEEVSKLQVEVQEELFERLHEEMVDPLTMIEHFLERPNSAGLAMARAAMEQINGFMRDYFLRGSSNGDFEEDSPPLHAVGGKASPEATNRSAMVLDIRYLRVEEPEAQTPTPATPSAPPPAPGPHHAIEVTAGPEAAGPAPQVDLEELLTIAVEAEQTETRVEVVAQLRALVPSPEGVELLGNIVEPLDDPRRLLAAQMLGHHRQWLAQKSGSERLLRWARAERDPEVGAALVWGLRNRDAIQEFLLHPMAPMAREAALGLPVNDHTVYFLVQALLVGRAPDVDRILMEKLRGARSGLVATIVEILLEAVGEAGGEEMTALLGCLPQVPLFRIFVEGEGVPQWNPQQTAEDSARAQTWHQLARLVETALLREPSSELVRHLVSRTARDETFARRHATFLEAASGNSQAVFSPELLGDLERLTATASVDKLSRLAELLVELSDRLDGQSARQAEALLDEWKTRSPDLKLKIYHLQQGLK